MLLADALGAALQVAPGDLDAPFVHEGVEVLALHFLHCVAQHLGHAGIDKGRVGILVDHPDALLQGIQELAIPFLALPQCLLSLSVLGDVAGVDGQPDDLIVKHPGHHPRLVVDGISTGSLVLGLVAVGLSRRKYPPQDLPYLSPSLLGHQAV